jgi:hypothetical protein
MNIREIGNLGSSLDDQSKLWCAVVYLFVRLFGFLVR